MDASLSPRKHRRSFTALAGTVLVITTPALDGRTAEVRDGLERRGLLRDAATGSPEQRGERDPTLGIRVDEQDMRDGTGGRRLDAKLALGAGAAMETHPAALVVTWRSWLALPNALE